MKIIILQENLREALMACNKAVATASSLPILNTFLLKTSNGTLEVTATNLEMSVTFHARCKIEEDGEVCVQAKAFSELVSSLPNEAISLNLVNNSLKLDCGKVKTSLITMPAQDYPQVVASDGSVSFSVNAKDLALAIHGTMFAVSSNETQAELCGVYIKASGTEMVFAGTNRYRLAEKKIKFNGAEKEGVEVILPAKSASELVRFCDNFSGVVGLGFEEGRMTAKVGSVVITSRLVDGRYPDYPAIIPQSFKESVKVKREELLAALKTMSVFAKNSEGLSFVYDSSKSSLSLSASSADSGSGSAEVSSEVHGTEGELLFNLRYLLDVLAYVDSEQVVFQINDSQSPVVLRPEADLSYLYLVMPIKT